MVHLFQAIAYCTPYYGRSYFDFLLFSLIFYFTLYSISFLFSYNIFLLFRRPLDIAILHSIPFSHYIPFNFHPIQFSFPYPVQVHILFLISFQFPLQPVSISSPSILHFKSTLHSILFNTPNTIPFCFVFPVVHEFH